MLQPFSQWRHRYTLFFTKLFWSDRTCINPLKEMKIFIANGQNFIFHIHVHICIYIFIMKFAHFFWKSYKTSVVSHGLHVLNLVSLEVPLPHCNAFGLCPQILFLPWASAAFWRRCDVTDGVG